MTLNGRESLDSIWHLTVHWNNIGYTHVMLQIYKFRRPSQYKDSVLAV